MTVTLDVHSGSHRKQLSQLSLQVAKSKRILVVTGAGISCSSGIPDFRSTDGLYNLVKAKHPTAVVKGKDLFSSTVWRDPLSTSVFYTFISSLKLAIDGATPSPTHHFIKALESKGKLLRSYTQNIDGLEARVGLSTTQPGLKPTQVKNVLLHGDIHRVRCTMCSHAAQCTLDHIDAFQSGVPPECTECLSRSEARQARSARALPVGSLRPSIVLYDEPHPSADEIGGLQTKDIGRRPDMLIVMGTSLKVHGLKKLVKDFASAVHNPDKPQHRVIFVNKTPPPSEWSGVFDFWVQGETDAWVEMVLADWKKMRPADWEVQQTLEEVGGGKVVKAKSKKLAGKKENAAPVATALPSPPRKPSFYISMPPKPTLPLPSKSRGKSISAPQLKFNGSAPLSPSKRQNRTYTRSTSSTSTLLNADEFDVASDLDTPSYDPESEKGSPRKKTKYFRGKRSPCDMSIDDIILTPGKVRLDGSPSKMTSGRGLLFPPNEDVADMSFELTA